MNNMKELEDKWKSIGGKLGRKITRLKSDTKTLKDKFDALDISPKETFTEIMNFCMEKGYNEGIDAEITLDSQGVEAPEEWPSGLRAIYHPETELRGAFSSGCAWEIVRKMSEL